ATFVATRLGIPVSPNETIGTDFVLYGKGLLRQLKLAEAPRSARNEEISHWGCGGRWFESSRPDHRIKGAIRGMAFFIRSAEGQATPGHHPFLQIFPTGNQALRKSLR
ncbi:MAG: hypothetical protein JWO25_27, partial [Alphaproteobacteria bacterium]|nr:hypothetical protein [Alphaproteobacteria bacterium]